MPELLRGEGVLERLPGRLQAQKILLVTYRSSLQDPGIARLLSALRDQVLAHLQFSTALLQLTQVAEQLERIQGVQPDVIVAIGGGSVLDLAKCLKLALGCELAAAELPFQAEPIWKRQLDLVAAPSTSGTGSEATPFATVYIDGKKSSVEHPRLVPDLVVLDPKLADKVPARTALAAGLDALAQALESVWSIHSNSESTDYAFAALDAILPALAPALCEGSAPAKAQLQYGAYLAGKAISISRTTLAHALSYPLSARYGLPHGIAVFLQLPNVVRFNGKMSKGDCTDPEGIDHYRKKMARLFHRFEVTSHAELAAELERLGRRLGLEMDCRQHVSSWTEVSSWVAESALTASRSGNNPRRPSLEAIKLEIG